MLEPINRTFSVAPMLDWTDRHERYFLRLISQHSLLYTEMVTTGALLYGNASSYLVYNEEEHPVALQLGGSDPKSMVTCAKMAEDVGYDEVNINIGCPSNRVQKGAFGACLMKDPTLVAKLVSTMSAAVTSIPITVKCRLGVDDYDRYEDAYQFIAAISDAGCQTVIVHARKAWLQGLSPKENRHIPPLDYERVYRLKRDFPHLDILINGGIKTLHECKTHLHKVDGVMMGREVYHNPWVLADVDAQLYNDTRGSLKTRLSVLDQFEDYMLKQMSEGVYLKHMSRHILGLFHGQEGAKLWRRHLSENAHKVDADINVIRLARTYVS